MEFADGFRADEDIIAHLLEVLGWHAQETEAFGCEFQHAIAFQLGSGEGLRALGSLVGRLLGALILAMSPTLRWLLALSLVATALAFLAPALAAAFARLAVAVRRRLLRLGRGGGFMGCGRGGGLVVGGTRHARAATRHAAESPALIARGGVFRGWLAGFHRLNRRGGLHRLNLYCGFPG